MMLEFSGRRVLIVGGTCELAIRLAESAIRQNLFPILTYRNNDGNNRIRKQLPGTGTQFDTVRLDFSDPASVEAFCEYVKNDVDYWVDFAHGNFEALIAAADPGAVRQYFIENISMRAQILGSAARGMLTRKQGRMVYISSTAAFRPNPGQGFYAAAKLASEALYKNLGLEMAGRGITTVILRPGYIDAGRGKTYLDAHPQTVRNTMPIGRPLTSREVAETILFYLSDHARSFNAVEITLDGGLSAGK